jgi:hypothetical protein
VADNTTLNAGTGGDVISTDDIAGVKVQRVKVQFGADGSATDVSAVAPMPVDGSGVTQPVSLASVPSHAVTNAGTFATQAAQSGTWTVQPGNTANTTAWKVDGSAVTQPVSGTVAVSTVNSVAPAFGSGVRGATVQRVTIATDDSVPVTGTFYQATQPVSGTVTANMGTVTADPFGANADAASATGSISAKLRFIASTGIPVTGTVTVGSHAVTNAGTFAVQAASAGDVAHDAADSGNPVKVGGKAVSSEPTAVAAADRTNFITDLVGKQIVLPYANPENFVSGAITSAMTGTTSTSLVSAPGSGLRNYITTIIVSNAHATVGTDVIIQDGSGGTTLLTIPAAAVYGGAAITLPVPLRQPTTNTALYCANVTTGASTKVSAVGYKGA